MKKILFLVFIVLVTFSNATTCYKKDRMKTFNLFEKAFKKNKVTIKNLYWNGDQVKNPNGYSMLMTFDGRAKRGLVWYDTKCNPISLKISSGFGKVTMYYYKVNGKKVKLLKTRKNKY